MLGCVHVRVCKKKLLEKRVFGNGHAKSSVRADPNIKL
jgi:hypothetical protein